jgi:hypothetical protein
MQKRPIRAEEWQAHKDIIFDGTIGFASVTASSEGCVTLAVPYVGWVTVSPNSEGVTKPALTGDDGV